MIIKRSNKITERMNSSGRPSFKVEGGTKSRAKAKTSYFPAGQQPTRPVIKEVPQVGNRGASHETKQRAPTSSSLNVLTSPRTTASKPKADPKSLASKLQHPTMLSRNGNLGKTPSQEGRSSLAKSTTS